MPFERNVRGGVELEDTEGASEIVAVMLKYPGMVLAKFWAVWDCVLCDICNGVGR